MYDIFVQEGATNVQFVWSPNRDGSVGDAINTYDNYYPGDDYLDYISFSGYNWGTLYTSPPCTWDFNWQNPIQVFGDSYDVMTARSNKPIIISEMASPEVGGDKAAWITNLFSLLPTQFPRVVSITWFNVVHREECLVTDTDWRVESSPASQTAFAAGIQYLDGVFTYGNPGLMSLSLSMEQVYWKTYSDYVGRILTTDFGVTNPGTADAYNFKITGSASTNMTEPWTTLPASAGNVLAGVSSQVELQYKVPPGVSVFRVSLRASVENSCGSSYRQM